MKKPEFKILTEAPYRFSYGIYRVKVTKAKCYEELYRHIRIHKEYYTHIDLNHFLSIGCEVELIQDGNMNSMIYNEDDLLAGKHIFTDYVDELYKIKKESKLAKTLLTLLWGALGEYKKTRHIATDENPLDLKGRSIRDFKIRKDYTYTTVIEKKAYKTNWGRISPFILANGRRKLFNSVPSLKHYEHIVRFQTDSIYYKSKVDIKHSDKLGQLKKIVLEKGCEIENQTKIIKY